MKTLVKSLLWMPLLALCACSGQNILVTAEPTPAPFGSAQGTLLQTSPTPPSPAQAVLTGAQNGVAGPGTVLQIPFSSTALGFDAASKLTIQVYNCTNTATAADSSIKACAPGAKPVYSAELPVAGIQDPLQLSLPGVKVGETVEFSGSGHDRGNCNPITAAPQRVKITESPLLWKELKWQTTDKICILKLKLSGKVTDTNQQPLALVQIEARSRDSNTAYAQTTETQVDGSFSLSDVPQGIPIEIKISKRGYLPKNFSASFLPTNFNQTEVKGLDFALSDPN
ncbi:MAG: carboxypeptidase regulatory-like domain-containing protein [Candidatus Sericytochromatia bacterium]|nr:carboxypeptidase regulatory-like domain-containing protein [Candidatus Sericytochromatia bacterium]